MTVTRLVIVALALTGCSAERPSAGGDDAKGATAAEPRGLPVVTPIRGTGELKPPEDFARFTFVVFGDNRPGKGEQQPETIKEIFTEIRGLRPAFALSLGDIIEGKPERNDPRAIDATREQFRDFLALAATAQVPIFNAPGNHEMDDQEDIRTRRMHRLYEECVGPTHGAFDNIAYVLAAHEHLYYNPRSPDNVTDVPGWKSGDPTVFLVSGGAGAPLNEGVGGFHHYLIFSVDGDEVAVKLVRLEGTGAKS